MSIWEGIMLGVIQGLTELLPVSSSAHLVIAQSFIEGFHQPGVLFDVVLHLGTLLAVIFFFRKDIFDLVCALVPSKWLSASSRLYEGELRSMRRKLVIFIVIGTIPAGLIGVFFGHEIHRLFESVEVASFMLLITGLMLFASDRVKDANREEMNMSDGIIIGIAQGIALIPGISRSGSTIAFGIFRKLDRETAARFSFLLSIPAVSGAVILESRYLTSVPPSEVFVYGLGFIAAAITGFLSLKFLFVLVKKKKLTFFAYYCWFVGSIMLTIKMLNM